METPKIKIIRMTEEDFNRILSEKVERVVKENRQLNNVRHAQKQLHQIGSNLSNLGLSLEGTKFHEQFKCMWNEAKKLNDLLINEIRKTKTL